MFWVKNGIAENWLWKIYKFPFCKVIELWSMSRQRKNKEVIKGINQCRKVKEFAALCHLSVNEIVNHGISLAVKEILKSIEEDK